MEQRKLAQANEHIKAAKKALKTSLFKWNPDHMLAASYYDKAAMDFRLGKDIPKTIDTYILASEQHYKTGSIFACAQALEKAAELSLGDKMDDVVVKKGVQYYDDAAYKYREAGDAAKGAQCLSRCAIGLSSKGNAFQQLCLDKFKDACELIVTSGKEALHMDVFRSAAAYCVKCKDFRSAIDFYELMGEKFKELDQSHSSYKVYLSLVIVRLATNDRVAARKEFEKHFDDVGYLKSDESEAAENLLRAFENNDEQEVHDVVVKSRVFNYLDGDVARLARSLNPFQVAVDQHQKNTPVVQKVEPVNTISAASAALFSGAKTEAENIDATIPTPSSNNELLPEGGAVTADETKNIEQPTIVPTDVTIQTERITQEIDELQLLEKDVDSQNIETAITNNESAPAEDITPPPVNVTNGSPNTDMQQSTDGDDDLAFLM